LQDTTQYVSTREWVRNERVYHVMEISRAMTYLAATLQYRDLFATATDFWNRFLPSQYIVLRYAIGRKAVIPQLDCVRTGRDCCNV
jgi:hypothetical protein